MAAPNSLLQGAVAGAIATAPMTATMELMHHALPPMQQHPLPPREITDRLLTSAGFGGRVGERDRVELSQLAHFAYGATVGAAYPLLMRRVAMPPAAKGVAYAIGVWAASYFGLLPAMGIMSPANRHPAPRSAVMILAHVVWGSVLGMTDSIAEAAAMGERSSERLGRR